jgi:hypothetical protein
MRTAPKLALPRRSLVLTSESANHPFRASLPAHVCETAPTSPRAWRMTRRDWRDVAGAYLAGFLAITIFII